LGNTELIKYELGASHPVQNTLNEISKASARGADIVQRILTFSQPKSAARTTLRLSNVAREVLALLRNSMGSEITVQTSFAADELPVDGDAAQMHQLMLNLCSNAIQSMENHGGVLHVSVAMARPSKLKINDISELPGGPCVRLRVADTGAGMPPETVNRIFEPFFTTKPPGKGTGLGLAVVHGIVAAHSGVIDVQSAKGRGSSFDVYLAASTSAAASPVELSDRAQLGRGEKILLVDDEPGVLQSIQEILLSLGYHVTPTGDPREAIGLFRSDPNRFNLVVTDLTMPHLSGADLVREIRRVRNDVPVVVVTGYVGGLNPKDEWLAGAADLLGKPFTRHALAGRISAALAKQRERQ
jgi:CheY-like chemotaxis protein